MARARRVDAIVAAHYSDFGSNTNVTRLNKDLFVYVSYRKGNRVFWSAKKHKVCSGETVISDGKNLARTRCGNRLSFTPKSPTAGGVEPGEKALNGLDNDPLLAGFPSPPLLLPGMPVQSGAGPAAIPGGDSGAGPAAGPAPAARSGAGFPPPTASAIAPVMAFGGPGPALLSTGPGTGPTGPGIGPTGPGTGPSGPGTGPTGPGTGPGTGPTGPGTGPTTPIAPIPEPTETGLWLVAGLGAAAIWRRRRTASAI